VRTPRAEKDGRAIDFVCFFHKNLRVHAVLARETVAIVDGIAVLFQERRLEIEPRPALRSWFFAGEKVKSKRK
jgi:hypothetical protein